MRQHAIYTRNSPSWKGERLKASNEFGFFNTADSCASHLLRRSFSRGSIGASTPPPTGLSDLQIHHLPCLPETFHGTSVKTTSLPSVVTSLCDETDASHGFQVWHASSYAAPNTLPRIYRLLAQSAFFPACSLIAKNTAGPHNSIKAYLYDLPSLLIMNNDFAHMRLNKPCL